MSPDRGTGPLRPRVALPGALLLAVLLHALAPIRAEEPRARANGSELRTLFIVLDAVPYEVAARVTDPSLGEQAHYRDFAGPVPLVSTFPSSTSVALGGILESLGLTHSPGYEARFFDWEKRKVRGGGPVSYYKIEFGWREFFDWSRKGPVGSSIEAVRPLKSGLRRLGKAIDDFASNDRRVFYIYIAATDVAAHVLDSGSLEAFLVEMEKLIAEARRADADRPFEVIIFSDHGIDGGEPLKNTLKGVKSSLRGAGFRLSKKLRQPDDLVLTPFGLVSSFEVYVEQGQEPRAAQALVEVEGVDLCVRHEVDRWVVEGGEGRADIRRREIGGEVEWAYEPVSGDPLGYLPILEGLTGGLRPDEEWIADEVLFAATRDSYYPDAAYRIARAFDLVDNPASLLCSVGSEYMYGPTRTAMLARFGKGRLRWTHGAISRESTLGFFMTDAEDWQPNGPVRFDRALDFFVERYRARGESAIRPE